MGCGAGPCKRAQAWGQHACPPCLSLVPAPSTQVCADRFDAAAATVVCKQLGCGAYGVPHGGARFGLGSGPILMDEVRCNGSEASLLDCAFNGW